MSDVVISVRELCKSFGKMKVLENVDLDVHEGEKIAIIGNSGCGKSLFLRLLEALEKPDNGHIFIEGDEITGKGSDIDKIRRRMGMVFQNFCLFEHMDVMDNLCLAPVRLLKMPREEAENKAQELLCELGLGERVHAWPENLSGGQKQRIAMARCLMLDPKIMLFDEPTSALDPTMVGEVLATMRLLAKRKLTMIVVTHEMNFAKNFADRILFFAEHGIYEQGTPEEIFDNPKKEKTIQFIRKIKNFEYHIGSKNFDLMVMQAGIHCFCNRYGINEKRGYRLELYTEEIVEELLERIGGEISIDISLEYSEALNEVSLEYRWEGDIGNPLLNCKEEIRAAIFGKLILNSVYEKNNMIVKV